VSKTRRRSTLGSPRIVFSPENGEVFGLAVRELVDGLGAMIGAPPAKGASKRIDPKKIRIDLGGEAVPDQPDNRAADASRGHGVHEVLPDDRFSIVRPAEASIVLSGASERALLHAVCSLLERLGARFPLGRPAEFPRIEPAMLRAVKPYQVAPAFARRAFVSDIMTWHYDDADRLELHLSHDREFIPWMARHGINAFSYIRHARDSRLKIGELLALFRERGIGCEYGGHVLQLLLPRERFESHSEYFPMSGDGKRMERGNLCVSNRAALEIVREGALGYVRENPEIELLHVWGADVWQGAWCRCSECAGLSPQLQYLKAVNAIAEALAAKGGGRPPVAYLAYHDTLEPDPRLKPLANVWFEWAPRERCYSHAIDDPSCETNPRCLEPLKRYIDLFEGRGHVFEYYADAVLFGGLGFATPSVIVRDLRAYRALGLNSISCLTFGAYSVLAYPVNLETFVRAARSPDFDPETMTADVAHALHPVCAPEMAKAYRAVARASAMTLGYGDVMRPVMDSGRAVRKRTQLIEAVLSFRKAIEAADYVIQNSSEPLACAERELWKYSTEALDGIAEYLTALAENGAARREKGEAAVSGIAGAIEHIRTLDRAIKGAWGAYDLEHLRKIWLSSMRRRLGDSQA
jgi:Domain of unknown function (DUF4838)